MQKPNPSTCISLLTVALLPITMLHFKYFQDGTSLQWRDSCIFFRLWLDWREHPCFLWIETRLPKCILLWLMPGACLLRLSALSVSEGSHDSAFSGGRDLRLFLPVCPGAAVSWCKGCLNNDTERGNCTQKLWSEGYVRSWRSGSVQGLVLPGECLITLSARVSSWVGVKGGATAYPVLGKVVGEMYRDMDGERIWLFREWQVGGEAAAGNESRKEW